jgi:hypothetical protein
MGQPLRVGRPAKYEGVPVVSVSWDELLMHIIQNTIAALPLPIQALVTKSPLYQQTHGAAPPSADFGTVTATVKYVTTM